MYIVFIIVTMKCEHITFLLRKEKYKQHHFVIVPVERAKGIREWHDTKMNNAMEYHNVAAESNEH